MKDFQLRVLEEEKELKDKVTKLTNYLKKDDNNGQSLLWIQLKIMRSYLEILKVRINEFEDTKESEPLITSVIVETVPQHMSGTVRIVMFNEKKVLSDNIYGGLANTPPLQTYLVGKTVTTAMKLIETFGGIRL
jgi:hypothetical protein